MNFFRLHVLVAAQYERLFARRFRPENERHFNVCPTEISLPRRRFSNSGVIFPTEPVLCRYQY